MHEKHAGTIALQRYVRTTHSTFFINEMCIIQEFDDYGNHRVSVNGILSKWYHHHAFAKLKIGDGYVCSTTEYWGLILPRVFVFITTPGWQS